MVIQWVEAKKDAKYPTMHRTPTYTGKELSGPKMSIVPRLRISALS